MPSAKCPNKASTKPPSRGRRFSLRPASAGQAVVEFALILPIMLVLMLMAIDFGRALAMYVQVTNAAREGAMYAAANPADAEGIASQAAHEVNSQSQAGEGPLIVTIDCRSTSGTSISCGINGSRPSPAHSVTVTASKQFGFITPVISDIFGDQITVAYSVTAPVLNLAPTGDDTPEDCTTPPIAAFMVTASGRTVTLNASASMPSTGLCAISGYNWDMGDGRNPFPPVVDRNATYTYLSDGTYDITLTVTNPAGYRSTTVQITVAAGAGPTMTPSPTPAATATPPANSAPVCNTAPTFTYAFTGNGGASKRHQMTFYGAYTGQPAPETWTWNFGDGTEQHTGVTTSHNFDEAGTFTVRLTVTNGSCVKTITLVVEVP
jgi:PKD repeat protein